MKVLNFKNHLLLSFFISSHTFTCLNPTDYADRLEGLTITSYLVQRKLPSGQLLQIELPPKFEEALDDITAAFDSVAIKITGNKIFSEEYSGQIKDGSSWKLAFVQNEETKEITCELNLTLIKK